MSYTPTGYKKVPALSTSALCTGCAFTEDTDEAAEMCHRVTADWRESGTSEAATHPCNNAVWIPDTPEGMTAYIAIKLES